MEKRVCSDGEIVHVIKANCEIPINLNQLEQHKIVYYYYIEDANSQIKEENYLLEKNMIRYLELESFLSDKNNKFLRKIRHRKEETLNIDIIDDVILFNNDNTYANLRHNERRFVSLYTHLIEINANLDIFGLNNPISSNFQCLKKFLNLNKCLLNEANDYYNELKEIFKKVLNIFQNFFF